MSHNGVFFLCPCTGIIFMTFGSRILCLISNDDASIYILGATKVVLVLVNSFRSVCLEDDDLEIYSGFQHCPIIIFATAKHCHRCFIFPTVAM